MRRRLSLAFGLLLAASAAFAQLSTTHGGKGTAVPPVVYTGPGDIVSGATAWYGLRCYNAAKAGASQAINIRRASDNSTTDIGLTGACNLASATSFCNATSCFLTEGYDQTGNGNNVLQATAAKQPQLSFNVIGSLPCIQFVGSSSQDLLTSATVGTLSVPYTVSAVSERTATFTTFNTIISGATNNQSFAFSSSANQVFNFAGGTVSAAATDSAFHALQSVTASGSTGDINVDGTRTTGTTGTSAFAGALGIGFFANSPGRYLTGYICETGVWPSGFTSGNETSICHNQFTYWGTPTSC